MRVGFGKYVRKRERVGIAQNLIAVIIMAIVLVAGVGAYYFVIGSHSSGVGIISTSTASSVHSSLTSSARSSSVASGVRTYSVAFNFSQPLGPGGERVLSDNTVQTYASVQVASGSFTFSINPQTYSGTGSGHGTLTVTTTGFCSGKVTFPYTFLIPDATNLLGGNITVFIGTPTPGNATVNLSCTGPMNGVSTATNNPVPFLSVYPNEISVATVPTTVNQHLPGNISYYYSITQTG